MPGREPLSATEISTALQGLDGWKLDGDKIVREYEFPDFTEAFGFLARVAILQEKADHHAAWSAVYNRVKFTLWTDSAKAITPKDIDLAKEIDALPRS